MVQRSRRPYDDEVQKGKGQDREVHNHWSEEDQVEQVGSQVPTE